MPLGASARGHIRRYCKDLSTRSTSLCHRQFNYHFHIAKVKSRGGTPVRTYLGAGRSAFRMYIHRNKSRQSNHEKINLSRSSRYFPYLWSFKFLQSATKDHLWRMKLFRIDGAVLSTSLQNPLSSKGTRSYAGSISACSSGIAATICIELNLSDLEQIFMSVVLAGEKLDSTLIANIDLARILTPCSPRMHPPGRVLWTGVA